MGCDKYHVKLVEGQMVGDRYLVELVELVPGTGNYCRWEVTSIS